MSACVCKDVPNEEKRPGRTASGKMNVLHAYIIRGVFVCELTTCAGRTPCFRYSLKNNNLHYGRLLFGSGRQPSALLWFCRALFGAWNRMENRELSRGWALQCTAVLAAPLCTPTLFHSCSASDNLSISCSISQPLLAVLGSFISPSSLYRLLSAFCHHVHFSPHSES